MYFNVSPTFEAQSIVNFVKIHIHLERSSRAIRLRLPEQTFHVLHWAKRIVQVGLVLLILQIGTLFTYDYLIESAAKQQSKLFHQLQLSEKKLESLDAQVRQSYHQEDLVHMKFGVTAPDPDARILGVGGQVNPDSAFIFDIYPVRGLKAKILAKMDHLNNQIGRTESSFTTIRNYMDQQFGYLRHLPSISPAGGRYSSGFGMRVHPVTGEREKMHYGIDISNDRWTPIYATADGVVSLSKYQEFFGNYIVVNHGNGYETKYGHMEKPIVKEGQIITRNQILGYMGRTGRTTGIHVHYEVWHGETAQNPINFVLSPEYAVE
jgi:murein DD-endopeptidase MepM/ murein hydrolase activator NlpD